MNEERTNSNFDINAKCQSMIEEANKIIKVYLETSNLYEDDGRYSLAYDVKNYLPKLQQENEHYKHIIDELEKYLKSHIQELKNKPKDDGVFRNDEVNDIVQCNLVFVLTKLQELKGSDKE